MKAVNNKFIHLLLPCNSISLLFYFLNVELNDQLIFEHVDVSSISTFLIINRKIIVQVVLKQSNHLENITHSWFIDYLALRDGNWTINQQSNRPTQKIDQHVNRAASHATDSQNQQTRKKYRYISLKY